MHLLGWISHVDAKRRGDDGCILRLSFDALSVVCSAAYHLGETGLFAEIAIMN